MKITPLLLVDCTIAAILRSTVIATVKGSRSLLLQVIKDPIGHRDTKSAKINEG
jgi:hypothetical protein